MEGGLLTSSHDRKHLALDILLLLLPKLPASFLQHFLSFKFVQCLMDTLSAKYSWLHKRHSEGKFDNVTRTKTVKDLAGEFETEDGCTLFLQSLMNLFVDEQHVTEETGDVLRSWIIESLPGVLKHAKLAPEAKLRVQKPIMKFLAVQGLFVASLGTEVTSFELQEKFKWPETATPASLCSMCIEQLQLLLSNSQKIETTLEQPDDDPVSYFMKFLSTLQSIPSVSHFRSLNEADENVCHALRHLVVQLLLKIFLHPGEFSEAASELSVCCDKAFSSSLDLLESDGEGEDDGEEEPTVMDVLVFKYFYQDVTSDGLLRMLRVIKKNLKLARHQDDLDDDEEDCLAIEDEEEEDENEEMGETGEHVDHMAVDMEIFKEKKNQSGGETAQSQLVLSKLHVLSLLEIYLHENPESPQVMTVYLNLAQAPVNPSTAESSQQLLNRICGIIYKKIFKSRELFKDGSLELSALASLLEKNLKLAAKPFKSKKKSGPDPSKKKWNQHKMIGSLAQNSTYWVLKIIDSRGFSETELEMVLDVFRMVLFGYFDSKKSQIKKSVNPKVDFRRVKALGLVSEGLRSLVSVSKETREESKKRMKSHMGKLSCLVKELVENVPEKQVRRAKVRKFCGRVFKIVSSLRLTKSFLKGLGPDGQRGCETALGDLFLNLKNTKD
ncbi:hypothetical protein Bca4012_053177 [Brassica carinata]